MATKAANAHTYQNTAGNGPITPDPGDGRRWSKYPNGDRPGTSPLLLRTHTTSGSMVGGLNNKGHWLKLFGKNWGNAAAVGTPSGAVVSMRDRGTGGDSAWHQVAVHNYLMQAANKSVESVLCVQVGGLGGGCANGNAVDIKVTVNGVDSNVLSNWYVLQPGDVWFVSPSTGSDTTFVVNDITKPAQHIQFWTGSAFTGLCASNASGPQPGDMICFIDGGDQTEQHGYYNGSAFGSIFRFAFASSSWAKCIAGGTTPTGAKGHGFIHFFLELPGTGSRTSPHFNLTIGGGIQGLEGRNAGPGAGGVQNGRYVSVTGGTATTRTGAEGDAGFVSCQTGAFFWQISDMEYLGWEVDNVTITNSSGFGGQVQGATGTPQHPAFCFFTSSHDVNGNLPQKQNHCYYWGGTSSNSNVAGFNWPGGATSYFEFAWNRAYNANAGSLFQFFWQDYDINSLMVGLDIHNNIGDTSVKYGINTGESVVGANVYNNVISNCGDNVFRLCGPQITGGLSGVVPNVNYAYNTVYGWNNQGSIANACIVAEGYENVGTWTFQHNTFVGDDTRSVMCSWYGNSGASDSAITMDQNVWWDYLVGGSTLAGTSASQDAHPIKTSPAFVNRNGTAFTRNLQTSATGSGVDASTTTDAITVSTDFLDATRPQGAHSDVGAYEYVAS